MEDFIIPINLAIKGFYNHLFANQRGCNLNCVKACS